MKYYSSFTRYIGKLYCSSKGQLHFTVYSIEPAGSTSVHNNIGLKGHQYNFSECVVLDDNILCRLDMSIDWSRVR